MGVVSLVRTQSSEEDVKDAILKGLDLIGFETGNPVKSVDIKPNLCYYWDAATGYTTDPLVVAGIIDLVREKCGDDVDIRIVESDGTAMRTRHTFTILGYRKLAKEKDVELFNLSHDSLDEKEVQVNGRTVRLMVPVSLLESDLFISVPKLKVQYPTHITCAFKNIFGCIGFRRKIIYHPFLSETIVAINKILRPNLTIVDGLVALGSSPVKLGLIMAGTDPFSVDWTASLIMGYNPRKIRYLQIAVKEGLGDAEEVETRGESVETFSEDFPRQSRSREKVLMGMQKFFLKLYKGIVKDVVPPALEDL